MRLEVFEHILTTSLLLLFTASAILLAVRGQGVTQTTVPDNPTVKRLYEEDQADRTVMPGKPFDFAGVARRDKDRYARVKEAYRSNQLHTGADYYHAAMILQHGDNPEDYLLAHELCIAAITIGEERARWLAAASEDRFLMTIGRPQRFATQFKGENGIYRLYETEVGVSDELRRVLDVPSLAEAKAKEASMNRKQ